MATESWRNSITKKDLALKSFGWSSQNLWKKEPRSNQLEVLVNKRVYEKNLKSGAVLKMQEIIHKICKERIMGETIKTKMKPNNKTLWHVEGHSYSSSIRKEPWIKWWHFFPIFLLCFPFFPTFLLSSPPSFPSFISSLFSSFLPFFCLFLPFLLIQFWDIFVWKFQMYIKQRNINICNLYPSIFLTSLCQHLLLPTIPCQGFSQAKNNLKPEDK